MVLIQKLCAGRWPAKREQAAKRQTDAKNYSSISDHFGKLRILDAKKNFKEVNRNPKCRN